MTGRSKEIGEYDQAYLEAWAMHEALRRLGFPAETIFLHKNPPPEGDLIVVVKRGQGSREKRLNITVGPPREDEDWEAEWTAFGRSVNAREFTEDELQAVWEHSWVREHTVELVQALMAKGFPINLKGMN